MKNDYEAVYRNTRPVPRTLEEAERNALYAQGIEKQTREDMISWVLVIPAVVALIMLARLILIKTGVL